jgi:hypothetical protein
VEQETEDNLRRNHYVTEARMQVQTVRLENNAAMLTKEDTCVSEHTIRSVPYIPIFNISLCEKDALEVI